MVPKLEIPNDWQLQRFGILIPELKDALEKKAAKIEEQAPARTKQDQLLKKWEAGKNFLDGELHPYDAALAGAWDRQKRSLAPWVGYQGKPIDYKNPRGIYAFRYLLGATHEWYHSIAWLRYMCWRDPPLNSGERGTWHHAVHIEHSLGQGGNFKVFGDTVQELMDYADGVLLERGWLIPDKA